ncbi:MAG: HigA family addiction module antitoxin [Eggerthellaceae bacterium]|jgi:addiction module HigA family antidote|nr:HigA family addiction module antitoxin [Eggerthellaceae bacterium]MDR2716114.1 HigA family addiction module antidote protein [Coriobacteriaceae bacterium]
MGIENNMMTERRPTHPGEMLREEYMPDYSLTVRELARRIGVSRQSVNELIRERRGLSTEMAVRLARLFGDSPQSWLNLQRNVDLWDAENNLRSELECIESIAV